MLRSGARPLVSRCLFATVLWVGRVQYEVLSARKLRSAFSVSSHAPIRKDGFVNALLGNDVLRNSDRRRTKIVGDVDIGYF